MKVLFIANRTEFGGAPKCMLELITLLQVQYDIEIEVVTHGENRIAEYCKSRNIKYYAVGHMPFAIGKGSTSLRRVVKTLLIPYYYINCWNANREAFKRASEMIDFSSIDVIHTNSNRDCLGAMLSKKFNISHVWHLREFGQEDYDIRYLKPGYIKYMNDTTDAFIAISDAVKKVWHEKGIIFSKITHIYDGIKLPTAEVCDKARKHQGASSKNVRFAYLGIVCPGKGQFDAIKALALLDKEISKNISIQFWGDSTVLPEYINEMKRFAKQHDILDSISFCGFTNNIWSVLPECDAALVCSRSEAFGRITPEYLSLGLQVIASDTGANPELIEDEITGFIYKHNNIEELAAKMQKVYTSSFSDREKRSKNAIERAKEFSDENHAKNMYAFYQKLLEKYRR